MELSNSLVKDFASIINKPSEDLPKVSKAYGTVVIKNGDIFVRLDGSSTETPVGNSVAVRNGDRVVVQIRDHKAYISDNFTAPPDGRVGNMYFKYTEQGLIIGRIDQDTEEPTGNYVLITDQDYRICNEDGDVLAVYSDTDVDLGANSDTARIYFCDRNGQISYANNILVLSGTDATGLRNVNAGGAVSQVAVAANANQLAAAMSILNSNGTVSGQVGVEWEFGVGTHVVLRGVDCSFNGYNVLTNNNFLYDGLVQITRKIGPAKSQLFRAIANVPSGYKLVGVRQVSTNSQIACVITSFGTDPSTNAVWAYIRNNTVKNQTKTVTVNIEWFALRITGTGSASDVIIDLDPSDGDGDDE